MSKTKNKRGLDVEKKKEEKCTIKIARTLFAKAFSEKKLCN
jgi:hypothetical protein